MHLKMGYFKGDPSFKIALNLYLLNLLFIYWLFIYLLAALAQHFSEFL